VRACKTCRTRKAFRVGECRLCRYGPEKYAARKRADKIRVARELIPSREDLAAKLAEVKAERDRLAVRVAVLERENAMARMEAARGDR